MRAVAAIALAAFAAPVAAETVISLPTQVAMQSDEEYHPWSDYVAPAPVRGTYIAGRRSGRSTFGRDSAKTKPVDQCEGRYEISGREPADDSIWHPHEWPEERFWFYRHGDEVLYAVLHQTAYRAIDCVHALRPQLTVVRAILSGHRIMTFERSSRTWELAETLPLEPGFVSDVPSSLILNSLPSGPTARAPYHKQVFEAPSRKPLLSNVEEECFVQSNGLDGSVTCYISTRGPLLGLTSFNEVFYHLDHSPRFEAFEEVEANIRLDGRLFEWDREFLLNDERNETKVF